jgi:hypothetical protein
MPRAPKPLAYPVRVVVEPDGTHKWQEGKALASGNGSASASQEYTAKIYNGRVRFYIDGILFFCFNQLDFRGLYAYKDDTALYGLDIYLVDKLGGKTTMEIYFKTKAAWLTILEILDTLI